MISGFALSSVPLIVISTFIVFLFIVILDSTFETCNAIISSVMCVDQMNYLLIFTYFAPLEAIQLHWPSADSLLSQTA